MCPVSADNAQDGTVRTVAGIARSAQITFSATGIDLPDNSLAHQRCFGRFLYHSNKLVSNCSFESCVAAGDFQISVANARQQYAYKSFLAALGLFDFADG